MSVLDLTNDKSDFENRPRVVIVAGPGFRDHDLIYCADRCRAARWQVNIATDGGRAIRGRLGTPAPMDKTSPLNVAFETLKVEDSDVVILVGGYEGPDRVRQNKMATGYVAAVAAASKIVAGLCHGPWVMTSARIMARRHAAAYPGLRDDLEFAGKTDVEGAHVVANDNIVTCPYYGDLGERFGTPGDRS